jgi:16S rRNA (guanine966-N2)-methyltransferase
MRLRIVSGTLGRRYITIDKKATGFRPTQERVRQSVAETLKPLIPQSRAADLCAGSGAMGIELVSRGAARVDFVESDRLRAQGIARHCDELGIAAQCSVITDDVRRFLDRCNASYDLIFFDPPYEDRSLPLLLPRIAGLLSEGGMLIYERASSYAPAYETLLGPGYARKERVYGDTAVDYISAQ